MLSTMMIAAGLAFQAVQSAPAPEAGRVIDRLPVLAGTQHIEHVSPRLQRPLQLFVKTPDIMPEGGGPLPIIYVLDADQAFPLLAAYSWSLTFSEEMAPSILVGIGYGSTQSGVNFRSTDYSVPAEGRPQSGGAETFLAVIEQEIMPLVEASVNADPARRTLVGQSMGGHFVLYQALTRPGLFELSVAINPAIHHSPDWFNEALSRAPEGDAQRLFISMADEDFWRFAAAGRQWVRGLAARDTMPWCVRVEMLEDHLHLTSMPRAFRQAMRWRQDGDAPCGYIDPVLKL